VGCSSWLVESQQLPARLYGIDNHCCDLFDPGSVRILPWSAAYDAETNGPFPLVARILMGGLCGACLCAASNQSLIIGAILGGVGGLIGAFAGYEIRRKLVAGLSIKDIFIALLEDLITIGLACFFVSRWLGYGAAHVQESIWNGRSWVVTFKHLFDSVIRAALTAGTFGWLCPKSLLWLPDSLSTLN
jgi:hypothetical protein